MRLLLCVAAMSLGCAAAQPRPYVERPHPPIEIRVRPFGNDREAFCVVVRVEPDPLNRVLTTLVDGPSFSRSWDENPIQPYATRRTCLEGVPAGPYIVGAAVARSDGSVLVAPRQEACRSGFAHSCGGDPP